jgi:hypothetical protein
LDSDAVSSLILHRRAWRIPIGTKHAAITRLGFRQFVARFALVEKLAIIHRHRYSLYMATVRAFQVAFGLHALYPIKLTISEIFQTLLVTPASIAGFYFPEI